MPHDRASRQGQHHGTSDPATGTPEPPRLAQHLDVSAEARATLKGHQPGIIWLTGLSGAGKSTIANRVEVQLFDSKSTRRCSTATIAARPQP